ncbi:MAG: superfamily protein [Acidobacteria bacterium]|nr:superfamily protein [Acidobacteriota bacterium]
MSKSTALRNIRTLLFSLHSTDRLQISFWCLLSLISLVFHSRIPGWLLIIAGNFAACGVVCALAYAHQVSASKVMRFIHDWAAFPLVVFTYKQVYFMVRPIHQGRDYDKLLMEFDQWLFRVNPTEWLAGFTNPCLTEALQIAYSLFYVFFIAIGLELYRKQDHSQFHYFSFTIVYGFFISYIGYFFLPAVGPRFTLHDFSNINTELPGLYLTPALRLFVNFFESIPAGVSNAIAQASAQRDVFPSGHTMMTLVAAIFAYKYRLRVRHYILLLGALLIFATVYLRYHYLVDLVAGALLVLPCMLTSRRAFIAIAGRQFY